MSTPSLFENCCVGCPQLKTEHNWCCYMSCPAEVPVQLLWTNFGSHSHEKCEWKSLLSGLSSDFLRGSKFILNDKKSKSCFSNKANMRSFSTFELHLIYSTTLNRVNIIWTVFEVFFPFGLHWIKGVVGRVRSRGRGYREDVGKRPQVGIEPQLGWATLVTEGPCC